VTRLSGATTSGGSHVHRRLEYGERIEGIVAYLVDASEVNIDTSRTMMTVADDFDQITELRL